ncbi:hypothetical protein BDZ94DRAFT_1062604 [Collybia nuda]|uniref:Uncharacterized protein n=1 Tax=Collybia nuda TaxID=64659 RepID=A0A9P5XYF2_9AGAR|nr:hypothetical protein BDZ94DRAFT_1062604 [Collybia nuda]
MSTELRIPITNCHLFMKKKKMMAIRCCPDSAKNDITPKVFLNATINSPMPFRIHYGHRNNRPCPAGLLLPLHPPNLRRIYIHLIQHESLVDEDGFSRRQEHNKRQRNYCKIRLPRLIVWKWSRLFSLPAKKRMPVPGPLLNWTTRRSPSSFWV